jgi:hypothetical protein
MSNFEGNVQQGDISNSKNGPMQSIANTIPFDILCNIFECYAPMETPDHPLETLLLVCRSWTYTAIHHTRIWSNFTIHLRVPNDLKIWETRVTRRLARCSPAALFDISITEGPPVIYTLEFTMCWSISTYQRILSFLAGADNELVPRWRRFKAATILNRSSGAHRYLGLPTPKLEVLEWSKAGISDPFVPHAPLLKTFRAHNNYMVSLPKTTDLTNVVELEFEREDFKCYDIGRMVNLVKMTACNSRGTATDFSGTFLALKELVLRWPAGHNLAECGTLVAPALNRLSIYARGSIDIDWVLRSRGLPLKQLEEAKLASIYPFTKVNDDLILFTTSLLYLLGAMNGLKILELDGPLVPPLVLKILDTHGDTLFQCHNLLLKINRKQVELIPGDGRMASMESLRRTYRSLVGKSLGELYDELESTPGIFKT